MSWSASELRLRLATWNRFKPSSKICLLIVPRWYIFCASFMLFLSCVCYAFVHVCLFVPCGHQLGKGWTLGSSLSCLIVSLHFPIGILGQVWHLILSIPDLCTLYYCMMPSNTFRQICYIDWNIFMATKHEPKVKILRHRYLANASHLFPVT